MFYLCHFAKRVWSSRGRKHRIRERIQPRDQHTGRTGIDLCGDSYTGDVTNPHSKDNTDSASHPAQTLLPTQTLPAQPKTYATLQPYLTNVTGYSSCDNSNYLSDITINQYFAPGETAKITVDLISPDTEGTYTGYWILTNRENQVFGETIYVTITVSKDETEEEPE